MASGCGSGEGAVWSWLGSNEWGMPNERLSRRSSRFGGAESSLMSPAASNAALYRKMRTGDVGDLPFPVGNGWPGPRPRALGKVFVHRLAAVDEATRPTDFPPAAPAA